MIKEIFEKCIFDFNKLLTYGFKLDNDCYIYEKLFYNNQFILNISIDKHSNIITKVIEREFNEEFTNINIDNIQGTFINELREEYKNILLDIKNNCCTINEFISREANIISKMIYEEFNDKPEFLWDKFPSYGVFRNSKNKKWYSVIMNLSIKKLDSNLKDTNVDVINIKINPDNKNNLLSKEGYYPAYHMNKNNWISIVLDNKVNTEEIFKLIKESYMIVSK